jgi:hypothetical protein
MTTWWASLMARGCEPSETSTASSTVGSCSGSAGAAFAAGAARRGDVRNGAAAPAGADGRVRCSGGG